MRNALFAGQEVKTTQSAHSGRRNRLSFVCQSCRKGKTKCDRAKPSCSRCLKHGIRCVYDVDRQTPPKTPNKDATIARLKREVEYWQARALAIDTVTQPGQAKPNVQGDVEGSSTSATDSVTDFKSDVEVRIRKQPPKLAIAQGASRDIKTSSDMGLIRQDTYLSLFFASLFAAASDNSLINSISPNNADHYGKLHKIKSDLVGLQRRLMENCTNETQKARVCKFCKRLVEELNGMGVMRTGIVLSSISAVPNTNLIENISASETSYSITLKDLIAEIESCLLPLHALEAYKTYFLECIYPLFPFLDRSMFEEALQGLIIPDPFDPLRVKLSLGTQNLRSKIEIIAIFLVIIRISYNAMKHETGVSERLKPANFQTLADEALVEQYPVTDEFVGMAQRCVSALDFLNLTTENIVCCILYLWTLSALSPEEGDFYFGQPTEYIMGLVSTMATNIGLHRDPLQYEQYQNHTMIDQRTINYRRRLWAAVVSFVNTESASKGRCRKAFENSSPFHSAHVFPSAQTYMDHVHKDAVTKDNLQMKIYASAMEVHELYALLARFEYIWSEAEEDVSLTVVTDLMNEVDVILDKKYNIREIERGSQILTKVSSHAQLGRSGYFALAAMKGQFFHVYLMANLVLLRTSFTIFIQFESRREHEDSENFIYFNRFFFEMTEKFLRLTNAYCRYYGGDFSECFSPSTAIAIERTLQLTMTTVFCVTIALILRFTHAVRVLDEQIKSNRKANEGRGIQGDESERKRSTLAAINHGFELILERLCRLSSSNLRLTFFPAFKMLLFFDHVLQVVKKRDLLNFIRKIPDLDLGEKIKTNLFLGFGFNVEKSSEILESLDSMLPLSSLSLESLLELREELEKQRLRGGIEKKPTFDHFADSEACSGDRIGPDIFKASSQHIMSQPFGEAQSLSADTEMPFVDIDFNLNDLLDLDFEFILSKMPYFTGVEYVIENAYHAASKKKGPKLRTSMSIMSVS